MVINRDVKQILADELIADIIENMADAMLVADKEWKFVYVNRKAEQILGRTRGELLGKSIWEALSVIFRPSRSNEFYKAIDTNKTIEFEEYFTTLNSWFAVRIHPSARGILCYFRDIDERKQTEETLHQAYDRLEILEQQRTVQLSETNELLGREIGERKQVEKELQKEREFLKVVLECVRAGIVACDDRGILTLFNQAAREFHGLVEEKLLPEQWAEKYNLYLPDGKTIMKKEDIPLFRALQEEAIDNLEMTIISDRGIVRNVLASGQALFDGNGKKQGAVVVMHDITERKQAEEALRQSERRLTRFLEAMPVGVFVIDANTNPYYLNSCAQKLLGQGIAPQRAVVEFPEIYQVYLSGTQQLYPSERQPIFRALQGESMTVDDMEIRPMGRVVPLEVWATPIYDEKGNVAFAIAVFTDITERKKVEEARKRATKLELENKEKSLDTLKSLFDEIHNQPLNDLKFLIKNIKDGKLISNCEKALECSLLERLQIIDRKLRKIYERREKQMINLEDTSFCLGEEICIDLKTPIYEILALVNQHTLNRDLPYFSAIRVFIDDIEHLEGIDLNTEDKIGICRFLEGALCNVGEHAFGATRLKVTFKLDNNKYILAVEDNGRGLQSPLDRQESLGSKNALLLAKKLGGRFRRFSPSSFGTGTTCELSWPVA